MRNFAFTFLILACISADAQTDQYHPFPDSNAVWNVHVFYSFGHPCQANGMEMNDQYFSYYIDGDTVLNGLSYKKIYRSVNVHYVWCHPSGTPLYTLIHPVENFGAMRQDTSAKQVFFVPYQWGPECLLYDFSMSVGDTLHYSDFCFDILGTSNAVVESIDSVMVGGNYRKRFNFVQNFENAIIEGIGNTTGPFAEVLFPFEILGTLLCFSQDFVPLYPDTATSCAIVTEIDEAKKEAAVLVYPNPFDETATMELGPTFIGGELTIFNTMGKLVRQQVVQEEILTLDRDGLADGVYFYLLGNRQGKTQAGKLIVQ